MGKKRATKATTNIQPYVGPESLDTPEQREVDQDQAKGSPAQQAVASPSETAAENAKAQKRLRMQAAFGNPMAAMALAMLAVQDNLISNAFQKIENEHQPCLELPSPPEQREVDQDQPTGSPAQEAALGPSETAAESAKTPNRRLKSIFRDPIPEIARKMQAAHDKQISDCLQKIQAASEPWWESLDTPEQREVDQDQITGSPRLAFWNFDTQLNRKANQDQPTGSPAQEAALSPSPSPSEPATIQASTKKRNVSRENEERDLEWRALFEIGWKQQQISDQWNKKHPQNSSILEVKASTVKRALARLREDLKGPERDRFQKKLDETVKNLKLIKGEKCQKRLDEILTKMKSNKGYEW